MIFNLKNGTQNVTLHQVGGKAFALMKLIEGKFQVPDGFVLTEISDIKEAINYFEKLGTRFVAVRSSASEEDGRNKSFAGQFDSFLNVAKDNLEEKILECFKSIENNRVTNYSNKKQKISVIIQKMLNPEISGVAFSINPVSHNQNIVVIEATEGLGDKLVQGEITPEHWQIKKDSSIIIEDFSYSQDILNLQNVLVMTELTKQVESFFSYPVDIEWAMQNNEIYLLQARHITGL